MKWQLVYQSSCPQVVAWNNWKCATQHKCLEMVNEYESVRSCQELWSARAERLGLPAVGRRRLMVSTNTGLKSLKKDANMVEEKHAECSFWKTLPMPSGVYSCLSWVPSQSRKGSGAQVCLCTAQLGSRSWWVAPVPVPGAGLCWAQRSSSEGCAHDSAFVPACTDERWWIYLQKRGGCRWELTCQENSFLLGDERGRNSSPGSPQLGVRLETCLGTVTLGARPSNCTAGCHRVVLGAAEWEWAGFCVG